MTVHDKILAVKDNIARVLVGREKGRVDAITQSVVAVFMEDGRYVLARWEDGVYEA